MIFIVLLIFWVVHIGEIILLLFKLLVKLKRLKVNSLLLCKYIRKDLFKIERILAICRWFISTLYGSYASRCTDGKYEKKPYNPILGEQFHCTMGDAKCVCEQVCHHPPISAFYLEDEKAGVSLNGHSK